MTIVYNERVIPFDVDETLVMHAPFPGSVPITMQDPYDKTRLVVLHPNQNMITLLRDEFARGAYTMVWSRGGFAWATAVIKALNLETNVELVLTKPLVYMDDTEVSNWLRDRVYIKPEVVYKQ